MVLLLALPLIVAACGGEDEGGAPAKQAAVERPVVVATTTQLGDIVRQVAGDGAEVHQVLQANTDPHEYEPRPDDVKAVAGAKVVFESGNEIDHWMEEMVEQAGGAPTEIAIAPDHTPQKVEGEHHEEGEEEEGGDEHGHEESEFDPHWWHDPRNVEAAIPVIEAKLAKAAPANAALYKTNAAAYLKKVQTLDQGIETCMLTVPPADRKLVTSHDAFGYFTARYGIKVVGAAIPSQSTEAQPSAGEIAKLADVIRREGVKAIFPESSINPQLAETLARQTGAKADYVLYGDSLGAEGTPGATYLGMEAANADAMVKGFTGGERGCTIAGL
ncbi:metal ABC transporter substrate-binding protein [Solirubrobacter phytolaccae]|uniref:Metal ABC transporter substrate-binding protein n=1 Tax=Solirubrobacter phytolaccae TaxID=1404360 RepID=A0A9X3NGK3_9ACTN|nr:metal ABC transporter substrate-binding protein [Solirubrobacter phytolaccae]MDA0183671.1 metal ABC transporter substrate-binding protein [Solirubrobacter phytolaccae]